MATRVYHIHNNKELLNERFRLHVTFSTHDPQYDVRHLGLTMTHIDNSNTKVLNQFRRLIFNGFVLGGRRQI